LLSLGIPRKAAVIKMTFASWRPGSGRWEPCDQAAVRKEHSGIVCAQRRSLAPKAERNECSLAVRHPYDFVALPNTICHCGQRLSSGQACDQYRGAINGIFCFNDKIHGSPPNRGQPADRRRQGIGSRS
jgi:hypothetical protein